MGSPARGPLPEPAFVGLAVGARALASVVALASGFRAVSDDDFARVVIAERWALDPRWDASGTSWLPAPFWISGLAMKLAGRGMDVARAVAIVLGLLAALAVYRAARWMDEPPPVAALGAAAASFLPWAARLGVATVPELPAAALTLLAAASLAHADPSSRRRLLGGVALLAATLSRYEAWPAALVFVAFSAVDLTRASSRRVRLELAGSIALALTGPIAWMIGNRLNHGDPLHFLARVAAYRQALGVTSDGGAARIVAYPRALVAEAPELVALVVTGAAMAGLARVEARRLRGYLRPSMVVVVQIAALSFAMMKDGAPTHHPERAMLTAMLLLAVLGVALVARGIERLPRRLGIVASSLVACGFLAVGGAAPRGDLAHRADEVAIGERVAPHLAGPTRALLEVRDYGFLAVQAAAGKPELVVAERSIDPRDPPVPSVFDHEMALSARLTDERIEWVIARQPSVAAFTTLEPVELAGTFGLYRARSVP